MLLPILVTPLVACAHLPPSVGACPRARAPGGVLRRRAPPLTAPDGSGSSQFGGFDVDQPAGPLRRSGHLHTNGVGRGFLQLAPLPAGAGLPLSLYPGLDGAVVPYAASRLR